jgi:hypothetical protein
MAHAAELDGLTKLVATRPLAVLHIFASIIDGLDAPPMAFYTLPGSKNIADSLTDPFVCIFVDYDLN